MSGKAAREPDCWEVIAMIRTIVSGCCIFNRDATRSAVGMTVMSAVSLNLLCLPVLVPLLGCLTQNAAATGNCKVEYDLSRNSHECLFETDLFTLVLILMPSLIGMRPLEWEKPKQTPEPIPSDACHVLSVSVCGRLALQTGADIKRRKLPSFENAPLTFNGSFLSNRDINQTTKSTVCRNAPPHKRSKWIIAEEMYSPSVGRRSVGPDCSDGFDCREFFCVFHAHFHCVPNCSLHRATVEKWVVDTWKTR